MKFIYSCLSFAAWATCAASAFAATASLESNSKVLLPAGGTVVLTAKAGYSGQPAALGWSIALPADWTFVGVRGQALPGVAPEPGSSGTLEFALTAVPAQGAVFSFEVRYPAGADTTTARSTVFIRADSKLTTLTPALVTLAKTGTARGMRAKN